MHVSGRGAHAEGEISPFNAPQPNVLRVDRRLGTPELAPRASVVAEMSERNERIDNRSSASRTGLYIAGVFADRTLVRHGRYTEVQRLFATVQRHLRYQW